MRRNCITTIHFSDEKIKPITIKMLKTVISYNLKDLNNDGSDEIGFLSELVYQLLAFFLRLYF